MYNVYIEEYSVIGAPTEGGGDQGDASSGGNHRGTFCFVVLLEEMVFHFLFKTFGY